MSTKNKDKEQPEGYVSLLMSVDRLKSNIRADEAKLKEKEAQLKELEKQKLKGILGKDYNNKWVVSYQFNKDQKYGWIHFYHITEAGKPTLNDFGVPFMDCKVDVTISLTINKAYEKDTSETKDVNVMKDVICTLYFHNIEEVTEEEVKLQVKLAMHLAITNINSALDHKLIYNVKELDAVGAEHAKK